MSFPFNEFKIYADNEFLVIEGVNNRVNWREVKGKIIIEAYPDPTTGGGLTTAAIIKTTQAPDFAAFAKNEKFLDFNGVPFAPTGNFATLEAAIWAIINTGGMGAGLATEAKQDAEIAKLQDIKDNQTNGTQVIQLPTDAAKESKQNSQIAELQAIKNNQTNGNHTTQITPLPLPVTFTQTQNPQYTAAIHHTIGNTPTDFFGITGSATKTIKVLSIKIYAQESQVLGGGNIRNMSVIRRSTANTGGTTTAVARVPLDSNYGAATANILAYTANPTVGTTVGNVGAQQLTHPLASTTSAQFGMELLGQPVILRGVAQGLYLNGLGVTRPNNVYSITIQWEEI